MFPTNQPTMVMVMVVMVHKLLSREGSFLQ